jgi:hypothetical protein
VTASPFAAPMSASAPAGEEEEGIPEEQLRADKLMVGAGEEDEETLLQVPAVKLRRWENGVEGATGDYAVKGSGELKILKNKKTGKARVLVRADTTGRILMNSSIQEGITYTKSSDKRVILGMFVYLTFSIRCCAWTDGSGTEWSRGIEYVPREYSGKSKGCNRD